MNIDLADTHLIMRECDRAGLLRNQCAYVLATAFWETARTMRPIHERGAHGYFDKYEPSTKIGKALGNKNPGDGFKFRGRGYVQLTGRANYEKAGRILGVNFLSEPDDALNPIHAAKILVIGMRDGWFTGKKVGDYVTLQRSGFVDARRVVNGTDRAKEIADLARQYDADLIAAGYGKGTAPPPAIELPRVTWWQALWAIITGKAK